MTGVAPYYSLTKKQTRADYLTGLTNALDKADRADKDAAAVIRHVEEWALRMFADRKQKVEDTQFMQDRRAGVIDTLLSDAKGNSR